METRQKILSTACKTFYQHGFHACGVEMLAQNAGVTKRTLYAHFGSKDGLIAAVLDYQHLDFMKKMQVALDQAPDAQAGQTYLQFVLNWIQEPDFLGCPFLHACAEYTSPDSVPHRAAHNHKRDIRQALKDRLTKAGVDRADLIADRAFLVGEGLIGAAQAGHSDLVHAIEADIAVCLV